MICIFSDITGLCAPLIGIRCAWDPGKVVCVCVSVESDSGGFAASAGRESVPVPLPCRKVNVRKFLCFTVAIRQLRTCHWKWSCTSLTFMAYSHQHNCCSHTKGGLSRSLTHTTKSVNWPCWRAGKVWCPTTTAKQQKACPSEGLLLSAGVTARLIF